MAQFDSCPDIHSENFFEVVIVGGGTCGLAVASRLCENAPGSIYTEEEHQRFHWLKTRGSRVSTIHKGMTKTSKYVAPTKLTAENILVLDALSDSFMGGWDNQFRSCQIPHLRSPMFFHPDPVNIDGMITYAHSTKRERDLMEIQNVVGKEYSKHQIKRTMKKKHNKQPAVIGDQAGGSNRNHDRSGIVDINMRDWRDYYRPSTPFFRDFCNDLIDRYSLHNCVRKDEVVSMKYTDLHIFDRNHVEKGFVIKTESGKMYGCKTCVVASGHRGKVNYPICGLGDKKPSLDASCHTTDIFYERVPFPHPRLVEKIQPEREKKRAGSRGSRDDSSKKMPREEKIEKMGKMEEKPEEMDHLKAEAMDVKKDMAPREMVNEKSENSEKMETSQTQAVEMTQEDIANDLESKRTKKKMARAKEMKEKMAMAEEKKKQEMQMAQKKQAMEEKARGEESMEHETMERQESMMDEKQMAEENDESSTGPSSPKMGEKPGSVSSMSSISSVEKEHSMEKEVSMKKETSMKNEMPMRGENSMKNENFMKNETTVENKMADIGPTDIPSMDSKSQPAESMKDSSTKKPRSKPPMASKPHLVIIGGGLTSAQLAHVACLKGIHVTLVLRGPVKIKHFDFHLDWVTKYRNVKKSAFYMLDTDEERAQLILDARGGGSINPEYHMKINKHQAAKRLSLMKYTTMENGQFDENSQMWNMDLVTREEGMEPKVTNVDADYVICATGISPDLHGLGFLDEIINDYPIDIVGGFPCLTDNLQWCEELPLYMVGKNASLRIGPTSANLDGARTGAERVGWKIQEDLVKDEREVDDTRLQLAGNNLNWYTLLSEA
ncbi:uncharacterized protein CXQ87_003457 [Candidozyma duobushaemuli]|uniref:Uncharacterized protein n=2 Tax=Candidozyma TaxID=3303203 RepID=A0ABX8IA87_9ASCO|nr:uncharacterized protein CXQ87_003457 [[Candida] duobushaemulonis]PVH15611.1 hypothetical protein CXQ87_003457 [[Candida] duobushaemulonis]QWU88805.1 hypothetical protein CA3LBN_003113 [[Candida] haemuloni]